MAGAGALGAPALARADASPDASTGSQAETWTRFFGVQRIWGYVDRHSVGPGERFDLMLSGGPGEPRRSVRVEFFRIGAGGDQLIWRSDPIAVDAHPAGRTAAALGPNWPPALAGVETKGWPPGVYSADVVEEVTGTRDVRTVQFVVTNPRRSGQVLVRLGTNTYQAYNAWGGHSFYPTEDASRRGALITFDRPCPPAFFDYDVYLVRWLEGLGVDIDYATNFDVHREPRLLDPYPLVISASHDEYWSREEFDAFERRIFRRGRSVAFFGANPAYFQVRYADLNRPPDGADRGRHLVCYKSLAEPIARRDTAHNSAQLVTARFRDGARTPETMLVGAAYQSWFDASSPARPGYYVARNDLPFIEGTGWKVGDLAAEVVGYEWDNRDPDGDGRRLHDPARSQISALAGDRIKVLFRGAPTDNSGRIGLAEAVWWESPAGAKVFDAGSTRWAWGLGKDGFVNAQFKRFNENLVRHMIAA
jgi:hypothetical protein